MVTVSRRDFIKALGATAALAIVGIDPSTPKPNGFGESITVDVSGAVLTPEAIEEAAQKAMSNFGKPDVVMMSPDAYNAFVQFTETEWEELTVKHPQLNELEVVKENAWI